MTLKLVQGSELASKFSKLPDGVLKRSATVRAASANSHLDQIQVEDIIRALSKGREPSSKSFHTRNSLSVEKLELATRDYYRCLLARALLRAFQKLVPKFRNEAARNKLYGRLSTAIEDIHLSDTVPSVFSPSSDEESDDVTGIVRAEFWSLVRAGYNPEGELDLVLSSAKREFARYLSQAERLTDTKWEESERYTPRLRLVSFFDPVNVETEQTMRWGVTYYDKLVLLNINPAVLYFDPLRRGVLAREAAALLTPKAMDRMEFASRIISEQSEYLAFKFVEDKYEKELWSHARHGPRKATRVRGMDLIDFFETYEMRVGENLYRELWSRLAQVGGTNLKRADYLFIFETLAARPTWPKFDPLELQLLKLLARKPDVGSREVARLLKLSIPTATKLLENVGKKAGLIFTTVVDVRRLGLHAHFVFMSTNKESEVRSILSRFLYCRQLYRSYGSVDLVAVIDTPQGREDFLDRFLHRMKEKGLINSFFKSKFLENFQNISFENYDEATGRWNVHWDLWKIRLRDALRQSRNQTPSESRAEISRFEFSKMDLQILDNLNANCRKSFSEIGRQLEVTGAYVGQRVRRLVDTGAFKPALWPLKLGAEDWGLFALKCDQEVARAIIPFLDQLPAWRGGLLEGDYGIAGLVWIPTGELKQFFKALDDAVIREGFANRSLFQATGDWLFGRFIPLGPDTPDFFSDSEGWLFNEEAFMSLVS